MEWTGILIGGLAAVFGGLATFLGLFLSPGFREKLRRNRAYIEWCANLYCELSEFERKHLNPALETKTSNVEVLVDYCELHKALIYEPKYHNQLITKDRKAADYLQCLHDRIDRNWHWLQGRHRVNLQQDIPGYIQEIISFDDEKRGMIRQDIKKEYGNAKQGIRTDLILRCLRREGRVN